MKPKTYAIVMVLWNDAVGAEYVDVEEFHRPLPMITVGLLLRQDKQGVTIGMNMQVEGRTRQHLFIPAAYIREVRVVEKSSVEVQEGFIKVRGKR